MSTSLNQGKKTIIYMLLNTSMIDGLLINNQFNPQNHSLTHPTEREREGGREGGPEAVNLGLLMGFRHLT